MEKKIYEDNELTEDSTIRNFRIVQKEENRDVSRNALHYNLQMIIAIRFKVDEKYRVIQEKIYISDFDELLSEKKI